MAEYNKSFKKLGLCLSFFLCLSSPYAQDGYKARKSLDIGFAVGSGTLLGTCRLIQDHTKGLDASTVLSLDRQNIPYFDRTATKFWSKDVARASDVVVFSSLLLPSYFYFNRETRAYSADQQPEVLIASKTVTKGMHEISLDVNSNENLANYIKATTFTYRIKGTNNMPLPAMHLKVNAVWTVKASSK